MSAQTPAAAVQPGPLRLTGYAAAHLLLLVPTLALFVIAAVGGALALVVVGIGLVLVSVPALRWVANRHRSMAGRVLGVTFPPPYRPIPPDTTVLRRIVVWGTDPQTWRDLAWALVSLTIGFALSLLTVILLLMFVTGLLWWFAAPHIMRARSRVDQFFLAHGHVERLEERVQVLAETRAESVDHAAAELRRIERDLHDGAQARLVALGMSLGMADDLVATDPEAARRLLAEARSTSTAALGDLRAVVRGIHPPVLADRGLAGAVQALALDLPVPVEVEARLDARPPAPVESALYFAIAECLANVGKHAGAGCAWVRLEERDDVLCATVGDDGRGGADPDTGTGIRGVMRRLAAFDGTMRVSSPDGGPTIIAMEVPCASFSPRTTPSSGTA